VAISEPPVVGERGLTVGPGKLPGVARWRF